MGVGAGEEAGEERRTTEIEMKWTSKRTNEQQDRLGRAGWLVNGRSGSGSEGWSGPEPAKEKAFQFPRPPPRPENAPEPSSLRSPNLPPIASLVLFAVTADSCSQSLLASDERVMSAWALLLGR